MASIIRLATGRDAGQVQAIYAPNVRDTAISFEVEAPSVREMRQRIVETLRQYPWLVCERNGEVLGYVHGSRHAQRAAYQWSVDVSVYIHERLRRTGVGRALYTSLFKVLTLQGFYNAYAGITLPNEASVGLHEALGFRPVGVYRTVGYKLGAWHDVGYWQLALRERASAPAPPVSVSVAQGYAAWEAALTAGLPLLRG
jgi:phosphinothricin acetyltransferase